VQKTYRDIFGWLNGNENILDLLLRLHRVETVLEIGSFLGHSACFFAGYDSVHQVTCVDPFREDAADPNLNNLVETLERLRLPRDFYHHFLENIRACGVESKISVLRGASAEVAAQVSVPPQDLIYVDGDHSYDGVVQDIKLWLPKARKVICGDDYCDRFPGLKQAVAEMLPEHRCSGNLWWYEVE